MALPSGDSALMFYIFGQKHEGLQLISIEVTTNTFKETGVTKDTDI